MEDGAPRFGENLVCIASACAPARGGGGSTGGSRVHASRPSRSASRRSSRASDGEEDDEVLGLDDAHAPARGGGGSTGGSRVHASRPSRSAKRRTLQLRCAARPLPRLVGPPKARGTTWSRSVGRHSFLLRSIGHNRRRHNAECHWLMPAWHLKDPRAFPAVRLCGGEPRASARRSDPGAARGFAPPRN